MRILVDTFDKKINSCDCKDVLESCQLSKSEINASWLDIKGKVLSIVGINLFLPLFSQKEK